ncbi:MAG: mechanosensitive ion channel [Nanoarchaeota archaeon]|nr:mechanosensitive ion channel [Nanoarchaeota archaeon]
MIYITRIYTVGDRIEINSKTGDVIDIGILYTTLLETREWITADLPTGRLTTIPNGSILSATINNYTKDHGFIWDEIAFPLDYKSDTDYAYKKFMEIVTNETKDAGMQASESIKDLGEKYYLDNNATDPIIHFALTSNEISVKIRYPVAVRQRGVTKHNISNKILEEIKNSEGKIQVATALLDIVGFPDINKNSR